MSGQGTGGRLAGRVAIVTGADSGIGQGIAEAFAREGADIAVVFHTDTEGAEETKRRVEAAGRRCILVQADVQAPETAPLVLSRTRDALGVADILVNNAGVGMSGVEVADIDDAQLDRVLRTDLYAPFYFCREFVRVRRAAGGRGAIINVTSVHQHTPSPGAAPYSMAKAGLGALTRSLCLEVAPQRIRVNNICPGQIETPMTVKQNQDPTEREKEMKRIPWNRPGKPGEIGHLAVYLASDEADYVTGQDFVIDGGLEMNWGLGA